MPSFYSEPVMKRDETAEQPVSKSMQHYVGPVAKAKAKKDGDEKQDDDGFKPEDEKK